MLIVTHCSEIECRHSAQWVTRFISQATEYERKQTKKSSSSKLPLSAVVQQCPCTPAWLAALWGPLLPTSGLQSQAHSWKIFPVQYQSARGEGERQVSEGTRWKNPNKCLQYRDRQNTLRVAALVTSTFIIHSVAKDKEHVSVGPGVFHTRHIIWVVTTNIGTTFSTSYFEKQKYQILFYCYFTKEVFDIFSNNSKCKMSVNIAKYQ